MGHCGSGCRSRRGRRGLHDVAFLRQLERRHNGAEHGPERRTLLRWRSSGRTSGRTRHGHQDRRVGHHRADDRSVRHDVDDGGADLERHHLHQVRVGLPSVISRPATTSSSPATRPTDPIAATSINDIGDMTFGRRAPTATAASLRRTSAEHHRTSTARRRTTGASPWQQRELPDPTVGRAGTTREASQSDRSPTIQRVDDHRLQLQRRHGHRDDRRAPPRSLS